MLPRERLRTIIAGPRSVTNPEVCDWLMQDCPFDLAVVISGYARGFDRIGYWWAVRRGIPVTKEPVTEREWNEYGRVAGMYRNERMIWKHHAEALCAVYFEDAEENPGTRNMIKLAENHGLKIHKKQLLKQQTLKTVGVDGQEIDEDDVPF